MEHDEIIRCLVTAVQAALSGEADVIDGELRLPADWMNDNEGMAVQVDTESEPGTLIYRLVPDPNARLPKTLGIGDYDHLPPQHQALYRAIDEENATVSCAWELTPTE